MFLNDVERESVAVGAAIAAGCRPCTQYHVRAARKAGLSDDDIRSAVERAELLRIKAATSTADFARGLLSAERGQGSPETSAGDRATVLTRLGAAGGGNAGYIVGDLLDQGRRFGVSDEALREAVQVASAVKTAAANFFERDVERALGPGGEPAPSSQARTEGCAEPQAEGCAGPQTECGHEPAQATRSSCC